MRLTHVIDGYLFDLKSTDCQYSSRLSNAFPVTSSSIDLTAGHYSLAKLTHTLSHHAYIIANLHHLPDKSVFMAPCYAEL